MAPRRRHPRSASRLLTPESLRVPARVRGDCVIGDGGRFERGYYIRELARGYGAGHLAVGQARAHAAQHAAHAHGGLVLLFGYGDDVALGLSFEPEPRQRVAQYHRLLRVEAHEDDIGIDPGLFEGAVGYEIRPRFYDRD